MIALIQRVTEASVTVEGQVVARIGAGMLTLVGVEKSDTHKSVTELAQRIISYRLFPDVSGKMNLDVRASGGQVLLVPQFTLIADTHKGRRPGFSTAATPAQARELFDSLVSVISADASLVVEQGVFGADMKVSLVNDGPVTFWLQTRSAS